jgi:hypothetical protein
VRGIRGGSPNTILRMTRMSSKGSAKCNDSSRVGRGRVCRGIACEYSIDLEEFGFHRLPTLLEPSKEYV